MLTTANTLSQYQVVELTRIFEEEQIKFIKENLTNPSCIDSLAKLVEKHRLNSHEIVCELSGGVLML